MKYFALFSFLGLFTSLFAQSNNCQLTLSSGDTLSNTALIKVSGDSLNIMRDSASQWIKVSLITEIRFVKDWEVWGTSKQYAYYSGIGAACISAVAFAIFAKGRGGNFAISNTAAKLLGVLISAPLIGVVFGLIGGVVGGVIAIEEGQDEVYDFSRMKLGGKLTTLQWILEQQRNN